jgi:hypothetical protein
MPKNYVAREHGLENGFENVYDVLHWDKEDNPVVLKKRVGGLSHFFKKDLSMEL